MGPKAQAAASFATATGGRAAIGSLRDAAAALAGERGTTVVASSTPVAPRPRGVVRVRA